MTHTLETASEFVDVGDTRIHVVRSGSGHPLVWLHGSGPGASGMSNFRENLPGFQDFENLVFDHPRFGASGRPIADGPLIPFSGERILAALDALGIERFSLLGNSYGGGVAAWIAATVPDRVEHLVLMAPGGLLPEGTTGKGDMPYGIQLLTRAMVEGITADLMREFTVAMLHDPALATEDLVAERLEVAIRNNPEIEGVPNMGTLDGLLSAITAKTLIVWGREDRFLLPAWSLMWLEAIEGSEVHIFARCGHWAQYERLESFNKLVGNFLRSNP